MSQFALRSQRVITPEGIRAATVKINDGVIEAVLPHNENPGCTVEDLGNQVLMPGLVDTHVHINEPGRTDWEGFNTATQAAAAGGITTLVDMPLNCIPVTINKQALHEKMEAVVDKLWVDVGFWGGVIPDSVDDLDELLSAGVLGVKSFLIDSGIEEFPNMTEEDLRKAMPILAKHNAPYLIHAELDSEDTEPPVIGDSYQTFLESRPKQWENDAIDLMIKLTRELKQEGHHCKTHIVHLSSAEALENISAARSEGLGVSAETCPHYLTLFSENIPDGKTLFKCCPPIRENSNREQLWQAIKDGVIDFIVSDHSPCTPQLKHIDSGDVEKAWGGISALQFGLPLIWTDALDRGFELEEVSRLMSAATADFAGLGHIKGRIAESYHADLLVFNDGAEYLISNDMIKHRHKITPYEGKAVVGEVMATYLRGTKVFENDQFVTGPAGQPLLKGNLK
ncbi:allantoinase AllB [Pseudomaricurvus alkylphenolicus]|uniref:allantoinase AllB n=1 Tax=Pseudomaricurvus alkylphenolicus TaxID=1306991 RepID=UPI00141EED35|nr:allantoinase AllB [Pseudomaricurvus alkylphenolicus]NIB40943.1 allantoinase AllB [Pseudomaricurvus alkylphenolicus]